MCAVSVEQLVCAYDCSVANRNEQPGPHTLCSIDRQPFHRRWLEIGPVGEAKEVHTCLHRLWAHMGAGRSTHAHTERTAEENLCLCLLVLVCAYQIRDDQRIGGRIQETRSAGLRLCSPLKSLGGFSTSPRALQSDQTPPTRRIKLSHGVLSGFINT